MKAKHCQLFLGLSLISAALIAQAEAPAKAADTPPAGDKPTLKNLEAELAAAWQDIKPLSDEYTKHHKEAISEKMKPVFQGVATKAAELAEGTATWTLGEVDGGTKTFTLKGEIKLLGLKFSGTASLARADDIKVAWTEIKGKYNDKKYVVRVPFEVRRTGDIFQLRPVEVKVGAAGEDEPLWSAGVERSGTGWAMEKEGVGANKKFAGIDFVFVAGGTFVMGKDGIGDREKPPHLVRVSSFYMGRTEVTQAQWKEVMGNHPSEFQGDDLPVESVTWFECVEFCNKLSVKDGLKPVYNKIEVKDAGNKNECDWSANGYRLPTEAEWEYAARGGKMSKGYIYAGSNNPDEVAWYKNNSGSKPHPVGQKKPNELGLYDMSGNVSEWCWDWHLHDGYKYCPTLQSNPRGPETGTYDREKRGGGWFYRALAPQGAKVANPNDLRVANRGGAWPTDVKRHIGFRLVLPYSPGQAE